MHNLRRCTPLAILLGILSCCLQPACVGSNWVDSCIDRAWESPPPGATTEARWSKAFALEHGDKGCSDRFRLEEFSPAETDRFPCLFPETPLPRQPDHRCDSLLRAPLGSSNSNDTTSFSAARAVVREMCPAASALAESLAGTQRLSRCELAAGQAGARVRTHHSSPVHVGPVRPHNAAHRRCHQHGRCQTHTQCPRCRWLRCSRQSQPHARVARLCRQRQQRAHQTQGVQSQVPG